MDYVQATQMAANIGQGAALLFGFVGLFWNPFLLFIALFVWLGASEEAAMVQMKAALGGVPLVQAMITNFRTLSPNEPLSRAVTDILAGFQQDFPVVEDERVVGVLTRADLLRALMDQGQDSPVSNVMRRDFATADVHEMLEAVAARLSTGACHSLPVTRDGGLVGMSTMENVGEFVMIQGALSEARQRHGTRGGAG
jgi:CBS domain-containing protein